MTTCSIDGCEKGAYARGWCRNHYMRWHSRGGDPAVLLAYSFATNDPEIWKLRFDRKWNLDAITGCWQWHGTYGKPSTKYDYKYGQFLINGVKKRAHRASWELHRGPISNGLDVLHRCNNALCVNPEHLYLGTHQQNMKDMAVSLRAPHLKLMPDEVRTIRASKESARVLAVRYGVDRSTIKDIKNRKSRKHVT